MNRKLINWFGLTGLAALISYADAAYFCRVAFPPQYFGIGERFSIYSAIGFNAVLGLYLFNGFENKGKEILN